MFTGILGYLLTNRYVLGLVFFVSVFTGGYIYYLRTSATIAQLQNDKVNLEMVVIQQKAQMVSFERDFELLNRSKEELAKVTKTLKDKIEKDKQVLHRENQKKKSLEELAIKKSSLIEKKVNTATDKVLKCFENISIGNEDCK